MSNSAVAGSNRSPITLFSPLGWVMGAISLLNLVGEFDLVKLRGKLSLWIEAYSVFVERAIGWLFGWTGGLADWLGVTWVEISPGESHLLMLAILFFSAICRVITRDDPGSAVSRAVCTAMLVIVPPVGWSLSLPGKSGLIVAAAWFGCTVVFYLWLTRHSAKKSSQSEEGETATEPDPRLIWYELIGVIAVFLLLIAVNYAFTG